MRNQKNKPSKNNKTPVHELSNEELMHEAEEAEVRFQEKNLKNLDHDELTEILQVLENTDKQKEYEIVQKTLKQKKAPPIEKEKTGHRIWSYYYDNWIFRWIFFALGAVIYFSLDFFVPDAPMKKKGVILFAAYLMLKTIWRIILAKQESSGSTFMRKRIGIVVVNKNGRPLGIVQNFLRGFFRAFPLNLFTVALMEFTKNDRGIHDFLFGSYVLRINEEVDELQIASFIKQNY
ncbi:MAG: RDD family protein [Spirochaetia bacterium]|nr:RDD family protein [Spirochaetia bacterium]